ncbi:MAG TPA: efflux RND transporter permease subunit [Kofleriaceae bacterium]|nr:efflux RND transporter permease subunit [Kofleriaceae bacterium]
MLERIVRFVLKAPGFAGLIALALVAVGLYSYSQLSIEAYPNPVPPLVEVIAQPPGWSAEETELYVTRPLEVGLSGIPGLDHIRSQSLFGLADVKLYFNWGTKYDDARQEVINRLSFTQLPAGVQPQISPWNAIGEVYRYTLEGKGYTLMDLKAAQDKILERQWRQVPGVIDVVSFGGETKQFQIQVDPFRLKGHGVTLAQLVLAVQNANLNSGGQRLEMGEQSYDIRGIGLLKDAHDIEDVVIVDIKGTPVRIKDVADVKLGPAPRLGMVGIDERPDVVEGVVMMRYGGETKTTLENIHARVEYIRKNHILPPGMEIKPYYDRGELVAVTTHTVMENVGMGIALVSIVLLLFLGHMRAALITAVTIPLALLGAFSGIVFSHTSANLISIGAVDFGIVVESSVIMMENILHHLGPHGKGSVRQRVLAAAHEVGSPMTFATVIIGVSFIPLFTMTGVSGVIFSPMARTYAFAIGTAILLSLTLLPVLAWKLIPTTRTEKDPLLMRGLVRVYTPIANAALRLPRLAIPLRVLVIVVCVLVFARLEGEFMPHLEEGNLWIRATLPMSISLTQSAKYVDRMRDIVRGCPNQARMACVNVDHPEAMSSSLRAGIGEGPLDKAVTLDIMPAGLSVGGAMLRIDAPDLAKQIEAQLRITPRPLTGPAGVLLVRGASPRTHDDLLAAITTGATAAGFTQVVAQQTHPEVLATTSQLGRPDDGTDVTGFFNIEMFAPLVSPDKFEPGLTKAKLIDELDDELHEAFPGVVFQFSQMIGDNVEEAVAGVKGENSIKVFGDDLIENEKNADTIVDILKNVRGIEDLGKLTSLGQPDIKILPDRKKCARYGLNSGDVVNVVQTAIGGQVITQVYEGQKVFDLTVRWQPAFRDSLEAIREIQIATPDGQMVPLGQVATVQLAEGPSNIYREDGQRYTPVKFSVRGRDLEGAIKEAQDKVDAKIAQGYGKRLVWSGEINELREAQHRLMLIVPLTLIIIAMLVYASIKNWLDMVIVLIDIPLACTGALTALLVTHTPFSVSAAMGLLSIFGIAIQDAILVVTYFQRYHYMDGKPIEQAASEASAKGFRPVLMTTLVAMLGLTPAALSHGIGSETQKPLAIAVIGGSLIIALLTRVIRPPLLVVAHSWYGRWRTRRGKNPNPLVAEAGDDDDDPALGRISQPESSH